MKTGVLIQMVRTRDFKRISLVEVDAGGKPVVVVGGRNGQGKSSLLDAIAVDLLGASAMPDKPVRAGAERAEIEIALTDGVRIVRKVGADGKGTIKITTADGLTTTSPQAWLDARLARFACDPVKFLAQDPKDQAATLRKVAGIDTTPLDTQRAALFATRTDTNRDAKRAAAIADAMPHYPDAPAADVDVAALSAQLEAASAVASTKRDAEAAIQDARRTHANAVRDAKAGHQRALDYIEQEARTESRIVAEIARLQTELATVRDGLATANAAAAKWAAKVAAVESDTSAIAAAEAAAAAIVVPDVTPIRAAIANAGTANDQRRANAARAKAKADADKLSAESAELTARIEAIDAQKAAALAAATFPIPGLSVDDSGPTFNGVPLSQASQAEKIRVAMGIALAGDPVIRVVLIRDASLLDADSMAQVAAIAEERGAQVWLERVGDDDADAVIIEDGTVVATADPAQTSLV